MKRTVTMLIALVALIAAGGLVFYAVRNSGLPVQAAVAARGEIREFVDEQAKTTLPVTYQVTMPFEGRILPIELEEGQRVERGQIVARIAPDDLQNELDEARAAVERLQSEIARNDDATVENVAYLQSRQLETSMNRTAEAAEERQKSGQERVDFALKTLQRLQQLGPARSEEELDAAKLAHVESQVNYRNDVLVWQAMKAIESAVSFLPQMIQDIIERKRLSRAVLEKQQLEATARWRQAELREARSRMASPIDGVVLDRHETDEQLLPGGTVLLTIGRLEDLQVEAEVLSQDVVRIAAGDPVEIYGPAVGGDVGQGVPGVVHKVYPGGFTKISSLGVEQQRVKVVVRFADGVLPRLLEQDLGVEFRVRARIFTDTRSDALLVPRTAVFRGADGGWHVYAVRQGRARLQPVKVGLMNDDQAEIVTGLRELDLVVLAPESRLFDGTRVKTGPVPPSLQSN
ncbi:MAG: HlyD family efflux transporter periplasmic adaptor subunit [Pirellulaceae bacterium]|nr:HlyD family efflux transporter periplasmic adaptor subunit [Pirellulaceae bacterium]